jgi:ERCC4-type nuclease
MDIDLSTLTIHATKPLNRPARLLASMGIRVREIEQDLGPVELFLSGSTLAIERRTGSSFLRGIQDKSLFTSAIYLREHFPHAVLIVEGEVDYEYSRFDPQAVRGAMSAMILEYGLSVLCTATLEETLHLIAMMARQEQLGIPEISLIPKRKAADLPDLQRRVVEMLPGAGRVMARQLLQHFGSVERIVSATESELLAMPGLGAKKVEALRQVFSCEYEAIDTERDLEDAIEVDPTLLFDTPVTLLGRQHYIFEEGGQRHVVDMVFLDEGGGAVVLVELKRGRLSRAHEAQLQRYLKRAAESPLIRMRLDEGAALRGVLATAEPCEFAAKAGNITVRIVQLERVIEVLTRLRRFRLGLELSDGS